jgi:hypothetical protein
VALVAFELMLDRHEAPQHGVATDPFMGTIVIVLIALLAAVIALALGLTWKGLLHWTGELLLIIGISLAARGISDVRREWTARQGLLGSAKQFTRARRAWAASRLWTAWNWIVKRGWFAWLRLRPHVPVVVSGSGSAHLRLSATATGLRGPAKAPADGTTEERLSWLENWMEEAWRQIAIQHGTHEKEVRDRQVAIDQEQAARIAEDQSIRHSMTDLAGGGLRLQAWGVACLLAGTVLTAIW